MTQKGVKQRTVMAEERQSCEDGRLLTAVLTRGSSEDATKFANERARGPLAAGLVKEGADLSRSAAVAGREAKEEAVKLLELGRFDDGQVADGRGAHLGPGRLGQELLDLYDTRRRILSGARFGA